MELRQKRGKRFQKTLRRKEPIYVRHVGRVDDRKFIYFINDVKY
jgi:hypothetical protein